MSDDIWNLPVGYKMKAWIVPTADVGGLPRKPSQTTMPLILLPDELEQETMTNEEILRTFRSTDKVLEDHNAALHRDGEHIWVLRNREPWLFFAVGVSCLLSIIAICIVPRAQFPTRPVSTQSPLESPAEGLPESFDSSSFDCGNLESNQNQHKSADSAFCHTADSAIRSATNPIDAIHTAYRQLHHQREHLLGTPTCPSELHTRFSE